MREKIIRAILDSGDSFISGEQLSKALGISRTAIWKHINALREEGYNIESVNKKGYRLAERPHDILLLENISHNLSTEFIGKNIIHLDTVGSTNDYAKEIGNKVNGGTLIISEQQTKGKGRLGRSWKSKLGDGIWMSLIIKPKIEPYKAPFLTLVAGASIIKALDNLGVDVSIKWPNDIILNHKKICGILTELSAEMERVNYIVMGIGINVKTLEFPEEIKEKATSLYKEGYKLSRVDIVRQFCIEFEKLYKAYILDGNKDSTLEICKKYSAIIGNHVYLIKNNKKELVECIDINENGNLIIKENNGEIKEILSGEVSIRGVKGYV